MQEKTKWMPQPSNNHIGYWNKSKWIDLAWHLEYVYVEKTIFLPRVSRKECMSLIKDNLSVMVVTTLWRELSVFNSSVMSTLLPINNIVCSWHVLSQVSLFSPVVLQRNVWTWEKQLKWKTNFERPVMVKKNY